MNLMYEQNKQWSFFFFFWGPNFKGFWWEYVNKKTFRCACEIRIAFRCRHEKIPLY